MVFEKRNPSFRTLIHLDLAQKRSPFKAQVLRNIIIVDRLTTCQTIFLCESVCVQNVTLAPTAPSLLFLRSFHLHIALCIIFLIYFFLISLSVENCLTLITCLIAVPLLPRYVDFSSCPQIHHRTLYDTYLVSPHRCLLPAQSLHYVPFLLANQFLPSCHVAW